MQLVFLGLHLDFQMVRLKNSSFEGYNRPKLVKSVSNLKSDKLIAIDISTVNLIFFFGTDPMLSG